jgi:hypothetical protein
MMTLAGGFQATITRKNPSFGRNQELWLIAYATNLVREDISTADNDLLLPGRGHLRSPVVVEATRMLWTRCSLKGRVIIEDTDSAKATADNWTTDRGIEILTDGSKFEEGYTGCAAV